jgi:multisubunit Na+/H+ antiporter MnhB subunit
MTPAELSELDRTLARGPRLCNSAVLGAGVGAIVGWLGGRSAGTSAVQGVVGGVAVGLLVYGYGLYASERERQATLGHFTGALAPYGLHRRSVTYPWSNH